MKSTNPQFKLRMPDELKERLEEAAQASGRSLNAEIVWRLAESFQWEQVDPTTSEGYAGTLASFSHRLQRAEATVDALTAIVQGMKGGKGK